MRPAAAISALWLAACASTSQVSVDAIDRANALIAAASQASSRKEFEHAAQLSAQAASIGHTPFAPTAHYNAACWFALSGDSTSALSELRQATDAGFSNVALMQSDGDLASLRTSPQWPELVKRAQRNAPANRVSRASPADVQLITSDIGRFWLAYDRARRAPDRLRRIAIFTSDYVERGTPGLIDYYVSKIGSVEKLSDFVDRHPRYYDAVREATSRVAAMDPEIREALGRFQALYPPATFSDVYFVIGRLSSGGTASSHGLLIGTEMYGTDASTPRDELTIGLRRVVSTPVELPHIILHELMHFMQSPAVDQTLLTAAIREGGAEFLADLALPRTADNVPFYRTWGQAHAAEIWSEFQSEMSDTDVSRWIGGNLNATAERPADLGYFIGYEISKRYFAAASNKQVAIRDLLEIRDSRAILAASGYDPGRAAQ
jgi:predicted Zn-dependent protease DUF2268